MTSKQTGGKAQSEFIDICTKCRHQLEVEGRYITAHSEVSVDYIDEEQSPLWEVLLVDLVVHLELKRKRIEVCVYTDNNIHD